MRKYLPIFSDLVDKLSICQLKQIYIPENADSYKQEIEDILHDIDLIIEEKDIQFTAKLLYYSQIIMLANKTIWESESKARAGGSEQDKLLKFTHSINGVRNTAKNLISQLLDERMDLKVDCLATDLPEEFGNWGIFGL